MKKIRKGRGGQRKRGVKSIYSAIKMGGSIRGSKVVNENDKGVLLRHLRKRGWGATWKGEQCRGAEHPISL